MAQQNLSIADADNFRHWNALALSAPVELPDNHLLLAQATICPEKARLTGSRPLVGADYPSNEIIESVTSTARITHQIVPHLAREVEKIDPPNLVRTGLLYDPPSLSQLYDLTQQLFQDRDYIELLRTLTNRSDFDCREYTATYFACMLASLIKRDEHPTFEMRHVAGLFFESQFAPLGCGHAWLTIGKTRVHPSLPKGKALDSDPNNKHARYVPLFSGTFTLQKRRGISLRVSGSPCLHVTYPLVNDKMFSKSTIGGTLPSQAPTE